MNNVNIIGRLASDPLKFFIQQFNMYVVKFDLAFDDRIRKTDGKKNTHFILVEAWKETGERIEQNCRKGDQIAISGHLEQDKYETKDGQKRSRIKIVASTITFLSPKHSKTDENGEIQKNEEEEIPENEDDNLPF